MDTATKKYGSFNLDWIVYFYGPIAILTPLYTYYMAVYVEQSSKPFPHSTITSTANHYPQNTFFRYFCGFGSSIIVLVFIAIHHWVKAQARKAGFHRMSSISYYIMLFGMLLFCIATETIDGKANGPLHTPCAVLFFIIMEIFIVNTTLYLHRLHEWDSTVISPRSLKVKEVLCVYVSLVWIYCLYGTYGS
jgi:hypothetical protein